MLQRSPASTRCCGPPPFSPLILLRVLRASGESFFHEPEGAGIKQQRASILELGQCPLPRR